MVFLSFHIHLWYLWGWWVPFGVPLLNPRRRSVLDDAIPRAADGGIARASGTERGEAQDLSVQLKLLSEKSTWGRWYSERRRS